MKFKFTVEGLDCPNCAAKLARKIEGADGISACKINFLSEKMTVEAEMDEVSVLEIVKKHCRSFSPDVKVLK